MKKIVSLSVIILLSSCTQDFENIKVNSEKDKNYYSLGAKFGDSINSLNLSEEEAFLVSKGFYDATLKQRKPFSLEADRSEKVQETLSSRTNSSKINNEKLGKEYLEKFISEGGQKTSSGLAYKIIREGEGEVPGPKDTVEIHFEATLPNGIVFGTTLGNNSPVRYPLDKIIAGWSEGIQLIKPGGEIKIVIPPELGYGDAGAPPKVPGGSTLIMNISLLSVVKAKKEKSK
jgi:FKBP-type peptidyl-prolyl cis-trans isomerase FkpA